jgi:uncharacterized protein YbjT (DUF2867 family)
MPDNRGHFWSNHGEMTSSVAPLAITGSTGNLGGRIARRLAAAGIAQRLLVRDPARAPRLPGATAVPAAYNDRRACQQALRGVETVLMVSAAETSDRVDQHRAFIDSAVEAGVTQLVYISFYGAAADATFTLARDHWATEEHLRASGLAFTALRDNIYADFMPALVGSDGVIRGPAGDGRAAIVAQDDIADATVSVLRDPAAHTGRVYELTGPEALTLADVADTITAVTGRPVSYEPETVEDAFASRATFGAPDWQVEAWVSTYLAISDGSLAAVTTAIPDLTGHAATPLDQVLRAGA